MFQLVTQEQSTGCESKETIHVCNYNNEKDLLLAFNRVLFKTLNQSNDPSKFGFMANLYEERFLPEEEINALDSNSQLALLSIIIENNKACSDKFSLQTERLQFTHLHHGKTLSKFLSIACFDNKGAIVAEEIGVVSFSNARSLLSKYGGFL